MIRTRTCSYIVALIDTCRYDVLGALPMSEGCGLGNNSLSGLS